LFTDSLFIIGGLLLMVLGAEGLVRGAGSLALRLGVTPLVVGLTIVAFGTGSPEFFLSVQAAITGNSGIAIGNVIGSNISNVALVLGVAALARPMLVRAQIIRREMPLMIGTTLLLCVLLLDGRLSRLDGVFLLCGAFTYTVFTYLSARKGEKPAVAHEFAETIPESPHSLRGKVLFMTAGLAALLLGANILLKGAVAVATRFGVSEMVIGLTIIAIGTSLPELATSVVASLRSQADVAFGNVIGSNIFNILAVLGAAAMIQPLDARDLRPLDLWVFIGSAVIVLPLMVRGSILNRWEGGFLFTGYIIYIYSLF
jgi:cation:H+ antiporter